MEIMEFVNGLLALVPVVAFAAPLIAFVIDTTKRFGLPDGYAPLVSGLLNLALYAVVYFVGEAHADQVQTVVEAVTMLAPVIVALFVSLLGTTGAHKALELIGIGYSHEA